MLLSWDYFCLESQLIRVENGGMCSPRVLPSLLGELRPAWMLSCALERLRAKPVVRILMRELRQAQFLALILGPIHVGSYLQKHWGLLDFSENYGLCMPIDSVGLSLPVLQFLVLENSYFLAPTSSRLGVEAWKSTVFTPHSLAGSGLFWNAWDRAALANRQSPLRAWSYS